MNKTAIVTGITGQDGPYLAKLLLEKGYKVYGLMRRYSNPNLDNIKFLNIENDIHLITGDVTDENNINHIIRTIKPNEFYNLAGQSFVGISWDLNKQTTEVNAVGCLNILNAIKINSPMTKFYQASTSEMFGNSEQNKQDEQTIFRPRSPYAISKLYAYWTTINFRESFSLHTSNGILFNHESPLRGLEFVTRKITNGVARIKLGISEEITLGNLDAKRDWGFAGDYVEAMWMMLQQENPDDYVISTGEQHSIRELIDISFRHIGIQNYQRYIKTDPRFSRPAEVHSLCGDNSKAKTKLGWTPKTSFEDMIKNMVDEDVKRLSTEHRI